MAEKYMISIDHSTLGTNALLLDDGVRLIKRTYKHQEQIVNV